ncbi:DUF2061 domain-containing protein [Mariniblastus fucicola]|uniref:DUF2061 domain-containing protein n=1 Tax=Mariniblastus fucicola TaxID=980251 RepID=A0A5B9PCV0_9BACT|nr:DUF2061 domain-containing protein [Mariniblastus fucicola]QEG23339.1 hypothetical protein MFFC18_32370 [Mariniblastus fucicola]
MGQYKRESHARSLIKGISWRIVATMDTILIVAIVTKYSEGKMNLDHAIKIGLYEFLIKYVIYYLHERIWEYVRSGDGLEKSRTLKKAISWRIVATTMTFIIAAVVLNNGAASESVESGSDDVESNVARVALAIAVIEFFTKFILYYVHERIWAKIPLGKIRNWLFGKKKA